MVVMMPEPAATLRIRFAPASTMYRLPAASIATPVGEVKVALVARPPSPQESVALPHCAPLPAIVVMVPPGVTSRTT